MTIDDQITKHYTTTISTLVEQLADVAIKNWMETADPEPRTYIADAVMTAFRIGMEVGICDDDPRYVAQLLDAQAAKMMTGATAKEFTAEASKVATAIIWQDTVDDVPGHG